ncbi:1,4-alpha-glucan branching protein GlgB [Solicola gregarius]|uniref:1,4-alpha-glucan branching enzyme GlgB n=1 Tax=Solicola gregarius TaxID=2908642 RepID=A0AA46TID2_9ACTN|nr:1,4-alpha-glucan branching protein GlgB [Solicola gregarius]UYM05902.1 1,4-alpha-glucan branching protein GlgB [Solicola gregarius]
MVPTRDLPGLWNTRGAHPTPGGTRFAVWAPNAVRVDVVGDFNGWGDDRTALERGPDGVWRGEAPARPGDRYKYAVEGVDGVRRLKADPFAQCTEEPPETASVVYASTYDWQDSEWLERRAYALPHADAMSVYEVHLGSWRRGRTYPQLAQELVEYVTDLGFTHVELMPVMEHPYGGSWGYQVSGYFAPTARFGTPDEFRALVDAFHGAGVGVILDWVPAHFPRDEWALARFDGTPLYEHADPRRGEHPDWGTYVFDYGDREVRDFLIASALFWLEEFHADGLRVDAVASMLYLDYSRPDGAWAPNVHGGKENLDAVQFLRELNTSCYARNPGIAMIAEESTAWPGVTRPAHLGGLGFGLKQNLGWMHDSLGYVGTDPIGRQHAHHRMTFAMMYAYSENFILPLSHDEVVHGKGSLLARMPGDRWQQLANLRALLAYVWAHPGKQLVFMGAELGQEGEWSDDGELDWGLLDDPGHAGLRRLVGDVNAAYREHPALWRLDQEPAGFSWIEANDATGNVFSFLRTDGEDTVACVANFAGVPHETYHLGLPAIGAWTEIINTDAVEYGGSGVGNLGTVTAEPTSMHGRVASAQLRLPPLGVLWLHREVAS